LRGTNQLSSILTALKKLEKDAPPPDSEAGWGRKVHPQVVIPKKVGRTRRQHRFFTIAGVFAVLVAGIWLVTTQRINRLQVSSLRPLQSDEQTTLANPNNSAKPLPPSNDAARRLSVNPPTPEPPAKNFQRDASATNTAMSAKKSHPSPLDASPPASVSNKEIEIDAKPTTLPAQMKASSFDPQTDAAKILTSANPSPMPDDSNSAAPSTDASHPEYPDKDRFEIQAIAWDEIPEQRLAVVNNSILREGDSADGASVIRIGKNDIIINENGRVWKIIFLRP
jgi:hypothetical protein